MEGDTIAMISQTWLENMTGLHVEEDALKKIPDPELELNIHVILKCVQTLGTLGTLIVGPIAGFISSDSRNFKGIVQSSTKFGKYGVIGGIVIAPIMTFGRMKSINADKNAFYDRCYRLRLNRNQVRVDRSFFGGLLLGAIGSPLIFKMCPRFGALFGMSVGVVSMGIYNNL